MKKTLILCFLLFVALAVFAGPMREEMQPTQINVAAFKGPTGFGIIQVMAEPPSLPAGFSWDFQVLPGPTDMVAKVASGEVDFALFPVNVAAKLFTAGPGYKLAAVVGDGLLYGITSNEDYNSITDLRGQTVYSVGKGATPDYLFRYLAQGLDVPPEIDFSYNNPTQLVQMYLAGEVDTVILPEPFATQVMLKKPESKIVADFQELWKQAQNTDEVYPISVLVVRPDFAAAHPDIVQQFLAAYKASIDFVNAEPEAAGALIEEYGIFPKAMAVPAIPGCNLRFATAAEARGSLESFLQVLLEADPVSIGGTLPSEDFYYQE